MTASNQSPASQGSATNTATDNLQSEKETNEYLDSLLKLCLNQPAALSRDQVYDLEEKFIKTGVGRRTALFTLTKEFNLFEQELTGDRNLAVAYADILDVLDHEIEGFRLIHNLMAQARNWILVAISTRDDCSEIMDEAKASKDRSDDED